MDVLEEYFITEDSNTPLCQQFDAFLKNIHRALKDPDFRVRLAVQHLESKEKEDFLPNREEFLKKIESRYDGLGSRYDGLGITFKQEFMLELYSDEYVRGLERYDEYQSDLYKLFYIILDQLDDNIRLKLRLRENWKDIDLYNNTIELLKSLREVCYEINVKRVHPSTDVIRKRRNFVACMQKKGQCVDDYVAEVQSRYNVLKVTGDASLFRTKELIEETIEREFPEFKDVEYDSLSDKERKRIEYATDQVVIALVILEGSKPSWKNAHVRVHAEIAGLFYNDRTREYEARSRHRRVMS